MPLRRRPLLALAVLLAAAVASAEPPPASVQSLLAAEGDFAAAIAAEGARPAFMERLAAMAVLLRPRAVAAADWLKEHPQPAGTRTWEPEFAEVSGTGALGYTTGPWRFVAADSSGDASGQYLAIWRYHPQTGWKLLVHAETEGGTAESLAARADPGFAAVGRQVLFPHDLLAAERQALLDADRDFGQRASTEGLRAAYARTAAEDLRLLRPATPPVVGKEAVLAAASSSPSPCAWEPVSARVAESGDLGYTFGTCRFGPATAAAESVATSAYVRVWRRDAAAQRTLVVDLAIPAPPDR